jgi:hypothetical protein
MTKIKELHRRWSRDDDYDDYKAAYDLRWPLWPDMVRLLCRC